MRKTITEIKSDLNYALVNIHNGDLRKLVLAFSRMKKYVPIMEQATTFIEELYVPTKKVPSVPVSLHIYCILNDIHTKEDYPRCDMCNELRAFDSLTKGFKLKCGARKCFQKHPETNKKRQSTAKERFGSLKNAYHDTAKETIRMKYGVDNISSLEEIKEKKKATRQERYVNEIKYQLITFGFTVRGKYDQTRT